MKVEKFILIAEYVGYVSPLIHWVEDTHGKYDKIKAKVLEKEANRIYKEMMEEYSEKEIQMCYDYMSTIIELPTKNTNNYDNYADLPF